MPYSIKHVGNKYAVIVTDTGKVVGTHPSKAQAQAQLGALYANVPEAKTSPYQTIYDQITGLLSEIDKGNVKVDKTSQGQYATLISSLKKA
mgnify:CR=1 FL=1